MAGVHSCRVAPGQFLVGGALPVQAGPLSVEHRQHLRPALLCSGMHLPLHLAPHFAVVPQHEAFFVLLASMRALRCLAQQPLRLLLQPLILGSFEARTRLLVPELMLLFLSVRAFAGSL